MSAWEILSHCEIQGVRVSLKSNGKLDVSGPRAALTEDLIALLKEHKPEIVTYLCGDYFDFHLRDSIKRLGPRGVCLMDYPETTRHRAMELEERITAAANEGNKVLFQKLSKAWRDCFH